MSERGERKFEKYESECIIWSKKEERQGEREEIYKLYFVGVIFINISENNLKKNTKTKIKYQ